MKDLFTVRQLVLIILIFYLFSIWLKIVVASIMDIYDNEDGRYNKNIESFINKYSIGRKEK